MRSRISLVLDLLFGSLRRRRSDALDIVRRAFSGLQGLLGLIPSPPKRLGGPQARADGAKRAGLRWKAPVVAGGDSVCCSTLPSHLLDSTDGSTASRSSSSDGEMYRRDTLVGLQEYEIDAPVDAEKPWVGSDDTMKQLSPQNSHLLGVKEDKGGCVPNEIPELSSIVEILYPVDVNESERYKRGIKITKGRPEAFVIPPLTIGCSDPDLPLPWTKYVHPEGAVYFWDSERRVITDAYIFDPEILAQVEDCISKIWEYIKKYDIAHPRDKAVHLYLEPLVDGVNFGYYFVDHAHKTLFWLDKKYGYEMVQEIQTPSPDMAHVGIALLSQYWGHNEFFPHLLDLPEDELVELQDILWHAVGDMLTSSSSTVPYTLEEIKNIQQLISEFVTHHRRYQSLGVGARAVVYRVLRSLTRERFLNFYGRREARLALDQSVFEEGKRTWFITLVSPLLFYAPEVHLKKLQFMSTDNLVNIPSWNKLLGMLVEEWKEHTLYATVLLTSNVSFLAIGSLDDLGSGDHRDPAQRASYFSVAVSIGAITLGLLLVRQHHKTLDRGFLINRSASVIGLETLAVMYSLPYALLMYATIAFFLAFSIMCSQSKDTATIIMLTIAWTATALLLLWCISASFEYTGYESPWLVRGYKALKKLLHQRLSCRKAAKGITSEESV